MTTHSLPWAAIALNSTHNKSTILKLQTDQVKAKNTNNNTTMEMTNKKMMRNKKCKMVSKRNNKWCKVNKEKTNNLTSNKKATNNNNNNTTQMTNKTDNNSNKPAMNNKTNNNSKWNNSKRVVLSFQMISNPLISVSFHLKYNKLFRFWWMSLSWAVVEVEKNILKILRILFINIMGITSNLLIIFLISLIPLNLFSSLRLMKHKDHSLSELTHSKLEEKNSLNLLSKEVSILILLLIGVTLVSKSTKPKSQ